MAILNVVQLADITNRTRIEAEFYRPEYVACYKAIKSIPHSPLRCLTQKITDGTHFTPRYTASGVRFYSAVNVKEGYFYYDGQFKFISANEHRDIHRRCPVRAGDVLIRKVGVGPRWSCVVPPGLNEFSIFVSVAMVRTKPQLQAAYLSAFINSRYGQLQLLRLNKGVSQPDLHLEDIGELLVPDASTEFQSDIDAIISDACSREAESKRRYQQAMSFLESELGLKALTFERPVGYTARFSELETFRRADAQHFQPRFGQLLSHLLNFQTATLRELKTFNRRGLQPIYVKHGQVAVVNSKHLGPQHVDYDNLERTSPHHFAAAAVAHLQPEDVLIYSTGAYVGRTNVYLGGVPAMASNHVSILRVDHGIDRGYLAIVMQSIVGQFQTLKYVRGSAQVELYPHDIDRFVIPLIDQRKQKQIGDLVRDSLQMQRESKLLLNEAKTRVETMIEEAIQR